MTQRVEAQGNKAGKEQWDDGSEHDNVTKIYVRADSKGINSIRFDYVKSGQPKYGLFHSYSCPGVTQTFELNHLKDEQLESVEGYYDAKLMVILGIQFKTNLRISELIGFARKGTKFSLAVEGKKIIGFHGSSDSYLNSLGAYFTKFASQRSVAKGGKGGKEWDDGSDHDGITNIEVRGGSTGIQYIKVDYVKDGQPISGSIHGLSGKGFTQRFKIDNLNKEYLVSVEGYYDDNEPGVIKGLHFRTNLNPSGLLMGEKTTRKFKLASNGKKILGFHGFAEENLVSLGAYFTTCSSLITKVDYYGDNGADIWDDGTFDGVRKVYVRDVIVGSGNDYIPCVTFHYDNGGKVETFGHGFPKSRVQEFEVDYPNEVITSVEETIQTKGMWISSLVFKTSKGRTSPTFGAPANKKYVLESKGCAIVGFHGRATGTHALGTLGAYFRPMSPPSNAEEEVEQEEGDGGVSWDDGVFIGIKSIFIGHNEKGIGFLKFIYDKDNQTVVGEDHGNKNLLEVDEFKLEYPSEYLTSVEAGKDVVDGRESNAIRMLRFKTNKKTSKVFGYQTSTSYMLKSEGSKIVGFSGKGNIVLSDIGIKVRPIAH